MSHPKLLILHVAALGYDLLREQGITQLGGLTIRPLTTVLPAVTCTAQATLRTALTPEAHGMTANGRYFPELRQSLFWHQASSLVKGERIWKDFRVKGGRVGMYFFQQSLGESVDEIISPAPIHTHGGGLIMATYSQPTTLLQGKNPAPLWRYWGPLASPKVGRGIANMLCNRLQRNNAPELIFAYLPTLDYDLQRYGTHHRTTAANVREVIAQVEQVTTTARNAGYELLICGDYAITDVTGTVAYPNRLLKAAGLFQTRTIKRMLYPDFHQSRAFVLCDHQVAILQARDSEAREAAIASIKTLPEVDTITLADDGTCTIMAKAGCWFAYPWWEKASEAPDYATHVDIHNKPGFDPCELFFGKTPFTCSMDANRIRGTHGRTDAPIAYATSLNLSADTLQVLAARLKDILTP
jgi:predicted AlkP superfamily pyrophosphatase or phosphodiesterase